MVQMLLVMLGGACGALARYGTGLLILRCWPGPLPLATWIVNVLGSLCIGLLLPLAQRDGAMFVRLFVLVGFLGSFTTFSTFSLETVVLWEQGHTGLALLNAGGSLVAGLLGVVAGLAAGRYLFA